MRLARSGGWEILLWRGDAAWRGQRLLDLLLKLTHRHRLHENRINTRLLGLLDDLHVGMAGDEHDDCIGGNSRLALPDAAGELDAIDLAERPVGQHNVGL